MERKQLDFIQSSINYNFKNLQFLEQAFTRKSYSAENPGIQNNEILEFYGDEILDFFVTKMMYKKFSRIVNSELVSDKNEGELTRLKSVIVSRESLSLCMLNSKFSQFLYLGKNDEQNRFEKDVNEDLFEAIIGAVAADSNWNSAELEKLCKTMLQFETLNENLSALVNEKCFSLGFGSPTYHPMMWQTKNPDDIPPENLYNSRIGFSNFGSTPKNPKTGLCEYWISFGKNDEYRFKGTGFGILLAKLDADKKAYQFLCQEEKNRFSKNLDFENPVSTLHELSQKKIIMEVRYEFNEYHDENGNPIWNCKAILEGFGTFESDDASKKHAKQEAAEKLLRFIDEKKFEEKEKWEIPEFNCGHYWEF